MHIKGFLRLLKKYRNGSLSGEKKETMDRWYDMMGEEIREPVGKELLQERIWEGVLSKAGGREAGRPRSFFERKQWWAAVPVRAALLFLFLFGGFFYYLIRKDEAVPALVTATEESEEWVVLENNAYQSREVMLPDGSRIVLEPGSTVRYPREFAPEGRIVYMTGDVFFDVTRDVNRPFLAYAGDVHVRVLGTSFIIREIEGASATEVAVITGKVVVEKAKNKGEPKGSLPIENKLVLTPNKKVTFFKDSDHYITGLVENPVMVEKSEEYVKPDAFNFDEVPLRRILEKLEKAYGVSVAVSDDKILDCQITADLSSDNLYGKMEVISAILNAQYEITGSSILLSGGVCNVLEK